MLLQLPPRRLLRRRALLFAVHVGLIPLAYLAAFGLRFDFRIPAVEWPHFTRTLPYLIAIRALVFWGFGLYRGYWRHVGLRDLRDLAVAVSVSAALFVVTLYAVGGLRGMPRSVFALDWVLMIFLSGGVRFAARSLREGFGVSRPAGARTFIIGAGEAAEQLLRQALHDSRTTMTVVGLIDDNPDTHGRTLHGVPVLGGTDRLAPLVQRYDVRALPRRRSGAFHRQHHEPGAARASVRAVPPGLCVSHRRVQACAHARGQCRRGGVEQRVRDAARRRVRGAARRGEVRADLDRQSRQPVEHARRHQADRRADRAGAAVPHRVADRLPSRALRQRARLRRQCGAGVQAPDQRGRPRPGHASRRAALLHDDPRGGAARPQSRRPARGGPPHRHFGDGPAGAHRRSGRAAHPALRARALPRHPDRLHRAAAGREARRAARRQRRRLRAHLRGQDPRHRARRGGPGGPGARPRAPAAGARRWRAARPHRSGLAPRARVRTLGRSRRGATCLCAARAAAARGGFPGYPAPPAPPAAPPPAPRGSDRHARPRVRPAAMPAMPAPARRHQFLPFSPPLLGEEAIRAVVDTLRSGWITPRPQTKRFEADFAEHLGAPSALALSSCTAGLHTALATLGVGPGDEVITTPLTFTASVNVIEHVGARPVLVDVE